MASTCEDCGPSNAVTAPPPPPPPAPATDVAANAAAAAAAQIATPRIVITYCTQCRWMLRAAYFAQELLSTFGTAVGEIALRPATGGIFTVHLTYHPAHTSASDAADAPPSTRLLWDRKAEGGFPETKVLKQRLRDFIEPERDLGHSDRHGKSKSES